MNPRPDAEVLVDVPVGRQWTCATLGTPQWDALFEAGRGVLADGGDVRTA